MSSNPLVKYKDEWLDKLKFGIDDFLVKVKFDDPKQSLGVIWSFPKNKGLKREYQLAHEKFCEPRQISRKFWNFSQILQRNAKNSIPFPTLESR